MAFTEDLTVFFDTAGFGEPCTYTPTVGAPVALVGIFDAAYFAAPGGEVDVAGSQPQLQYQTSALATDPVYGEQITVKGKTYLIIGIHPDGTGVTTLILEAP